MKKKKVEETPESLLTCGWCGNKDENKPVRTVVYQGRPEPIPLCDDECHENLKAFGVKNQKKLPEFLLLWIAVIITGFIFVLRSLSNQGFPVGVLILFAGNGILLILYPFVPFKTIQVMGACKGARLSRILGVVNILMGIGFYLLLLKFFH